MTTSCLSVFFPLSLSLSLSTHTETQREATLVLKIIGCPAGKGKPGVALAERINAIKKSSTTTTTTNDANNDDQSKAGGDGDDSISILECQSLSSPGKDFYMATFTLDFLAFLIAIGGYKVG